MDTLTFQKAQENDLNIILDIYNFYILTSTATFDLSPISRQEFCQRIFIGHEKYETYLIRSEGEIAGFCFLTQYKKKKGYDRTAEAGVYLRPEFTGKGIGREATALLEKVAVGKQIRVLVTCICAENTASIRLMERMGYEKCSYFRQVGEKFGRLLDVVDFQKVLDVNDQDA